MQNDRGDDIYSRRISIFEVILIALILLVSIGSILWVGREKEQQSLGPKRALIYHADKLLEEVGLEEDRFVRLDGVEMEIEVKRGKIRVARSDCPKQICVNMGWIKTPGQVIACVPNEVVVEIDSGDFERLDAVAY
jgi:hypothetical protein